MSAIFPDSTELPVLQARTQCVLIPRDPNFIYAYWDYAQEDINSICKQFNLHQGEIKFVLRVYDISFIKFNGLNANHTWDIDVASAKNWYVHVWQDNAQYCVDFGISSLDNQFFPLIRSNSVRTPPKSSSKRDDLIWLDIKSKLRPYIKENSKEHQSLKKRSRPIQERQGGRAYYLTDKDVQMYFIKDSNGPSIKDILRRRSKGKVWQKVRSFILNPDLIKSVHPGASGKLLEKGVNKDKLDDHAGASENLLASKTASSESLLQSQPGASEGRLSKRKFFFEIWTELIVHGRTEPDAAVWLNEKGIKLNPDGTFSLRYSLPDGDIPLKFIAQSSDGVEQRHIYTRVERQKTIGFPKMLDLHG